MKIHGLIHQFPKEIKATIVAFIVVLSVGFYSGIRFVNTTTSMQSKGIETNYLGNEEDEAAVVMKFKKSKREILAIVHSHTLSMGIIFFLLALILATTSLPKKLKYFLMIEPFFSIIFTFGGIYFLWLGILWFKYVIMISGILMTLSFLFSTLLIFQQILYNKSKK